MMKTQQIRLTYPVLLGFAILAISSIGTVLFAAERQKRSEPILETIEWTDIWITNANKDDLPRVLFVGDSITKGYFKQTEKELDGKANCARYATSAFISHQDFLDGLAILLDRYDFDVIHINNGLHGWGYTEEQYRAAFPALIKMLKQHAPRATIIWALTTPLRERGNVEEPRVESTRRVRARNKIATEFATQAGFGISDLFSLSLDHPEYYRDDGTHYNSKGVLVQAKYVAGVVNKALVGTKR